MLQEPRNRVFFNSELVKCDSCGWCDHGNDLFPQWIEDVFIAWVCPECLGEDELVNLGDL